MPDAGDDAAKAAADVAVDLLKWAGHKGSEAFKNRHNLVSKQKTIIKNAKERLKSSSSGEVDAARTQEAESISCIKAYASNPLELREMCALLDSANIEYAFKLDSVSTGEADLTIDEVKPDKNGIYRFFVPDRTPEDALDDYVRFEEAPDAIQDIVWDASYEKALERMAFYKSLESLEGKWKFSSDSPVKGDLSFDFQTMAWDREANLLKKAFDSADVSYTCVSQSAEKVHFDIPASDSKQAAFVITDLIATVNGMYANRFKLQTNKQVDLNELTERGALIEKSVSGEESYLAACKALDATDVCYEASFDEEANVGKFSFSASDVAVHGWNLSETTAAEVKEALEQRQASDERPSQQKKIPVDFDVNEAKRSEASERTATPAKDAQHALQAQRLIEQTITQDHVPVQSRGR